MAEEDKQPGETPDERPRPQFGELAPPGWQWHPPQDADRLDTARHSPAASEPDPQHVQHPAAPPTPPPPPPGHRPGGSSSPQLRSSAPRWNLTFTVLLLVFGFFGMSYSIGTLQALPSAMELLHTTQKLGAFTPADSIGGFITAGSIAMAGIWAISAGLSVWLLVQRRLSFYVPLVAGVLAMVVLFVIVGIVLATDPVLLNYYSGITPTSPATPTPSPTTPASGSTSA